MARRLRGNEAPARPPAPDACQIPMRNQRGFTLIELLVVLAIFGLIASWAMPNLQGLVDGAQRRADRGSILSELARLGYRCFIAGHDFTLQNATMSQAIDASGPAVAVPSGWQVSVAQPIAYRFDGTCAGGRVVVHQLGGATDAYVLRAPRCVPEKR